MDTINQYESLCQKYFMLKGAFTPLQLKDGYRSSLAMFHPKLSISQDELTNIKDVCDQTLSLETIHSYEISCSKYFQLSGAFRLSDIKGGFRNASLKYHPDKGGDAEDFNRMKKTYDITLKILEVFNTCDEEIPVYELLREFKRRTDIYNFTLNMFTRLDISDDDPFPVFDIMSIFKRQYGHTRYYGLIGLTLLINLAKFGLIGFAGYSVYTVISMIGFWKIMGIMGVGTYLLLK